MEASTSFGCKSLALDDTPRAIQFVMNVTRAKLYTSQMESACSTEKSRD